MYISACGPLAPLKAKYMYLALGPQPRPQRKILRLPGRAGLPPVRYTRSHIGAVRYIIVPHKEKGDAVNRMP